MNRFSWNIGNFTPIRSLLWAVAVSLVLCASAYALPLTYSLHGYVFDQQGQQRKLSGSMVIDNNLVSREGDSLYQINQFNLATTDFSYSGGGDSVLWFGSSDIKSEPGDLMWGLVGTIGSGEYNWVGSVFQFCNADGTPYDQLSEYAQLAPIINLWGPSSVLQYPDFQIGFPYATDGKIVASLNPIPERSTVFLLIFGIVAFVGMRRTKFFRA
jgi:hypothetical protein